MGTQNTIDAAVANKGIKNYLSTDKAAYPINAMGISKRDGKVAVAASGTIAIIQQLFCLTRYGNVMASKAP
jgi:UDP-glucose 4-epimerase